MTLFTPVVFLAPALFRSRVDSRSKWILSSWSLPFVALYACYFYTSRTWWYLRFVLPVVPAVLIAAMLVAQDFFGRRPSPLGMESSPRRRLPPWRLSVLLVFASVGLYQSFWIQSFRALKPGRTSDGYLNAHRWVEDHLAEKPVILCSEASGSIFAYTPAPIVRWDWLTKMSWAALRSATSKNHQILYAILARYEIEDAKQHNPGEWTPIAKFGDVSVFRIR